MLSSPRSPSRTIRILSSAENRRRVFRRMSLMLFSADASLAIFLSFRGPEVSLKLLAVLVQLALIPHKCSKRQGTRLVRRPWCDGIIGTGPGGHMELFLVLFLIVAFSLLDRERRKDADRIIHGISAGTERS